MAQKREVTIYDIAKALNLSASTVSRGLRNHPAIKKETAERIQKMAWKLNYQQNTFARNLRKNRSNTIGVILTRFDSGFLSMVISGIEEYCSSRGYTLLVCQSHDSHETEKQNLRTLYNSRVDGLLIAVAPDTNSIDHLDLFLNKRIPVVQFDRVVDRGDHPCTTVSIDNRRAGYDATMHLIDQGCRRIAYLGENKSCPIFGQRLQGYLDALEEAGIVSDEELIITDHLDEGSGMRAAEKILAMRERPDGLFAANDVSAVGVIYSLRKAGIRIPGEFAVIGFNNVLVSRVVEPALTTMNYPGTEMGRIAAKSLLDMLDGEFPVAAQSIILHHELVVRDSSVKTGETIPVVG